MRHIEDWDKITILESGGYNNPVPGGYVVVIREVDDNEKKECLYIRWDFTAQPYTGANQETFDRAGFWPSLLIRSYKESALSYFKAFKVAVEKSNPGYVFDDRDVQGLVGKRIGVVLGEEEYMKKNGNVGTRLYVYQTRSVQAIRERDFTVPELKKLKGGSGGSSVGYNNGFKSKPSSSFRDDDFGEDDDTDGDLPF